ncbi:MAG: immunoglobulin-like domain-containing protein [Clostridia bacterium]
MKRNNKIILICGLLLIILIVLATFLYSKNGKEHENIVVLNAVNDTNVDMVDRYANLTSEEIDKLTSERTLDKVSMEIKEGTLTNKGATIIITDRNELPYSYGEAYKLEKLEKKEWKALWNIYYAKNDIGYIIGRDGNTEIDLNWEEYYKELEKGKYRILMQVIPGDDNTIISTEFEIK